MLKTQIKIMLNKKGFKISFTFMMFFAVFLPVLYMITSITQKDDIANLVDFRYAYFFDVNSLLANCAIYFIPVLSALPFSFSYISDHKLKCAPLFISRTGSTKYYISKALSCFVGAFVLFLIPSIVNICICRGFFPNTNQDMLDMNMANLLFNDYLSNDDSIIINPEFSFLNLFINHPIIYNVFLSLMLSVLAGACAILAFAVSLYLEKYYFVSVAPMIILFLLGAKYYQLYQSNIISNYFINITLTDYVISDSPRGKSYLFFGLSIIIISLISFVLIIRKSKQEQV